MYCKAGKTPIRRKLIKFKWKRMHLRFRPENILMLHVFGKLLRGFIAGSLNQQQFWYSLREVLETNQILKGFSSKS